MEKLDVKTHLTHVQLCEDSGCFRCSFLDLAGTWMKKLPWLTEKKMVNGVFYASFVPAMCHSLPLG